MDVGAYFRSELAEHREVLGGGERIFARQIEASGRPGEVAIDITTSGRSPYIVQALRQAGSMGIVPAAFGGKGGEQLVGLADPF